MKRLITSGIHTYPGTEYFVFDFSSDSNQDVINLCRSSSDSVLVNGIEVILSEAENQLPLGDWMNAGLALDLPPKQQDYFLS